MKQALTLLVLLTVVALSGCASTGDIESIQAQVRQANATADAALKAANSAKAEARNANETALAAKASADATEDKVEYLLRNQKPKRK